MGSVCEKHKAYEITDGVYSYRGYTCRRNEEVPKGHRARWVCEPKQGDRAPRTQKHTNMLGAKNLPSHLMCAKTLQGLQEAVDACIARRAARTSSSPR